MGRSLPLIEQVPTRSLAWRHLERLGAWGALDQAVLAGSGFLVAAAVARTAGPSGLGMFTLAQGCLMLLAGVIKACFGDPAVVAARGDRDRSNLAVARPVALALGTLGLAVAAGWWLSGGRIAAIPVPVGPAIVIVALLPFAAFTELARSLRIAGMGERALFAGDLGVAAARLGGAGLCLALGLGGAHLGLAALALGGVASLTTVYRYLRKQRADGHMRQTWRVGRWLVGESLLFGIGTHGIWLLISLRAGLDVTGELRAGQQLFAPVETFLIGMNALLLGRLAETKGRLLGATRSLVVSELTIVAVWGGLLVGIGPWAAAFVFGDGFRLGHGELALLSVALVAGTGLELAALRLRATLLLRPLVVARLASTIVSLAGAAAFATSIATVSAILLASRLIAASLAARGWVKRHQSMRRSP